MAGAAAAEEMIDVYDWRGRWTGVTKPKSEVHADGDIHICVHGVITDGSGQVIAQFRGPNVKLMRNVWDVMSVAGHISALTAKERENPANWDIIQQAWAALQREFEEEIGVDLSGYEPFSDDVVMFGITRTDQTTEDGWRDRTLSVNFMIRMPHLDIRIFKLEEGKVLDVRWMSVDGVEVGFVHREQATDKLAVREPDQEHLILGVVDCARRMMIADTPEEDEVPQA